MPQYNFVGIARNGAEQKGLLEAQSKELASRELRARGLTLLSLELSTGNVGSVTLSSAASLPSRNEIQSMTGELAVLVRSGLPLDKGLKILIDMAEKPAMKSLMSALLASVKEGKGLSMALEPYQEVFGSFYINMIRSGEASGHLTEILESLAEYLQNAKETRDSVVSALIYPSLLLVVTLLSVTAMLGFVVPQFETLFADMGDGLPSITQFIINMADGVKAFGLYGLVLIVVLVIIIRNWFVTPVGKKSLHSALLKIPMVRGIVFEFEVSKFARTVGTLLSNGVPMLKSINIAIETVDNVVIKDALNVLPGAVKAGKRIGLTLEETKMFTPMVIQMATVGEESGNLAKMMLELARVFDANVKAGVKRSLTLLEPVLILFMGGAIALIMVGIMMGILSVNELVV